MTADMHLMQPCRLTPDYQYRYLPVTHMHEIHAEA